ncbi:type IV / VI secretion system protein, partial [Striga asiatica]
KSGSPATPANSISIESTPFTISNTPFTSTAFIIEFGADLIPLPKLCGGYRHPKIVLAEYHGSLAVISHEDGGDSNFDDGGDSNFDDDYLWFEIWSWSHLSTVHVPSEDPYTEVVGLYNNDKVILVYEGAIKLYYCGTSELQSLGVIDDYKDVEEKHINTSR